MNRSSVSVFNYMQVLSVFHLGLVKTTDRTFDRSLAAWNMKPVLCHCCAAQLSSCLHMHVLLHMLKT